MGMQFYEVGVKGGGFMEIVGVGTGAQGTLKAAQIIEFLNWVCFSID